MAWVRSSKIFFKTCVLCVFSLTFLVRFWGQDGFGKLWAAAFFCGDGKSEFEATSAWVQGEGVGLGFHSDQSASREFGTSSRFGWGWLKEFVHFNTKSMWSMFTCILFWTAAPEIQRKKHVCQVSLRRKLECPSLRMIYPEVLVNVSISRMNWWIAKSKSPCWKLHCHISTTRLLQPSKVWIRQGFFFGETVTVWRFTCAIS